MTDLRHAVDWKADMEIRATIFHHGGGSESIELQWRNLLLWLKNKQPLSHNIHYDPDMYQMNHVLGYRRLKLAEVSINENIQYRFYEIEPFRITFNERFECYRAANGVEVFVDNGPILAALMTCLIKYDKIKIDYAINRYIRGHLFNIQMLKDNSWVYDFMIEELGTTTPPLPDAPYM